MGITNIRPLIHALSRLFEGLKANPPQVHFRQGETVVRETLSTLQLQLFAITLGESPDENADRVIQLIERIDSFTQEIRDAIGDTTPLPRTQLTETPQKKPEPQAPRRLVIVHPPPEEPKADPSSPSTEEFESELLESDPLAGQSQEPLTRQHVALARARPLASLMKAATTLVGQLGERPELIANAIELAESVRTSSEVSFEHVCASLERRLQHPIRTETPHTRVEPTTAAVFERHLRKQISLLGQETPLELNARALGGVLVCETRELPSGAPHRFHIAQSLGLFRAYEAELGGRSFLLPESEMATPRVEASVQHPPQYTIDELIDGAARPEEAIEANENIRMAWRGTPVDLAAKALKGPFVCQTLSILPAGRSSPQIAALAQILANARGEREIRKPDPRAGHYPSIVCRRVLKTSLG